MSAMMIDQVREGVEETKHVDLEESNILRQAHDKSKESWPWVEKYRPADMNDLVSHEDIISTLNQLINAQKLPHLLFYGPPGTGKTSTIMALARKLYGKQYSSMVLELNASDDRGIQVVREQIKEFAGTRKLFSQGTKLIILDEADAMTNDAQFSLRRVIEKFTRNVRFCLICNYVSKIIPALQSRCTRFRFSPLPESQIMERVKSIAQAENLNMADSGFNAILRLGKGDMRTVLNVMQATSMAYDVIDEHNVYTCTGSPLPSDIENIMNWLLNEKYAVAFTNIRKLQSEFGYAVGDILTEVYSFACQIDFPPQASMFLFDELAKLEHRLAFGSSEELQLASLVGVFSKMRGMMNPPSSQAP